jgi:polysaccharide export outer membrane protein
MSPLIAILLTLLLAPQAGVAADQRSPHVAPGASAPEYSIGVEDILEISVWKNTELTRTVQVRPDGKITLPLINDLQAAGLTPAQLRDSIATSYAKFFSELEISVSVREVHSIKISILGMVKNPGRYELKSQATVLEALALAGSFSEYAKRDKIFVTRRVGAETKRIVFNYLKVLTAEDEDNFLLLPGDIVIVP